MANVGPILAVDCIPTHPLAPTCLSPKLRAGSGVTLWELIRLHKSNTQDDSKADASRVCSIFQDMLKACTFPDVAALGGPLISVLC